MKAIAVAALAALLALAYLGMWRGWQGRARRQADLPEPSWLDRESEARASGPSYGGTYVATTTSGHWLDRITAHGLGTLSRSSLAADAAGLQVRRDGAAGFRIPSADLLGVRRERGIAGKVRDRDGIVVVTWSLGGTELDTGFRPDHAAQTADIEDAVETLMKGARND